MLHKWNGNTTIALAAGAVLLFGAAFGCNGGGGEAAADAGPDQAAGDAKVGGDAAGDATTGKDLAPDGPKLPARWVTVKGAAPATARHTATKLQDGRVLIVGGYYSEQGSSKSKYHQKAWIYDPSKDLFSPAGPMKVARALHAAVLLPGGRVVVFGGADDSTEHDTTESYNPANNTWSSGPKMQEQRMGLAAVTLNDGRVLIAGGWSWGGSGSAYKKSLAIFVPKTNSFTLLTKSLAVGRSLPATALLKSGSVLIAGGDDGSSNYTETVEVYDPASGNVKQLTDKLSVSKSGAVAVRMQSGKVLITGGRSFLTFTDDLYDPLTDKMTSITQPGGTRRDSTGTLLKDGRVLVVGGYETAKMKKTLAYNPAAGGSWEILPEMKHGRARHSATLLDDGSVLVVGGLEGSKDVYTTVAERFIP